MEITNELLAAYAEGNVTPEERKAIREYLSEHPSQLESVMMIMDEDYEIIPSDPVRKKIWRNIRSIKRNVSDFISSISVNESINDSICQNKAAAIPNQALDKSSPKKDFSFNDRLEMLLNEINN